MPPLPAFGLVILAAGKSSRMGKCKALTEVFSGISFAESILSAYRNTNISQAVIVVNQEFPDDAQFDGLSIIRNGNPEKGMLHSAELGVRALKNRPPWIFVHPVDHPFVSTSTIQLMIEKREADYVIPHFHNKGGHPVLIGNNIIRALSDNKHFSRLDAFLSNFRACRIEVNDAGIHANCNTPEDIQHFLRLLEI